MHPHEMNLIERLVTAIERMSEDVKKISGDVSDLTSGFSQFLNEKRNYKRHSQQSYDEGDGCPLGSPAAAQEASDNAEPEETCVGDAASFSEGIKINVLCKGKENYKSGGLHNTSEKGKKRVRDIAEEVRDLINIREDSYSLQGMTDIPIPVLPPKDEVSSKETNQQPQIHGSGGASSSSQIAPSQPPAFGTIAMNTQEHTWKDPASKCTIVFVQNLQGQMPFALASCSTGSAMMGQSETADRVLPEGHGRELLAGQCENQYIIPSEEGISANNEVEIETQKSTPLMISHVRNKRGGGKSAYECRICEKSFVSKFRLATHMRNHTKERPFMCTLCSKAFKSKAELRIHMRFHVTERPYKCSVCEKAFVQKSDLTKHIRTHTGEKPFQCEECGKCFARKDAVTDHMNRHRASRPFVCPECGKRYKSMKQLGQHTRREHAAASAASGINAVSQ